MRYRRFSRIEGWFSATSTRVFVMPTTIRAGDQGTRSHSGTSEPWRGADVPRWDLVGFSARPNSRAVQTSPFSPTPPELRSGRGLPAARSARSPTTLRVVIGDADGTFRRALRASFAGDPGLDVVGGADERDAGPQ